MKALRLLPVFLLLATAAAAGAQDVTGTVNIERKLTRRSVTAPVPIYQRGAVAPLGHKAAETTLGFERSRVVLYLESASAAAPAVAAHSYTMQQVNREFSPDLLVVPVGATVTFPNMDPIFHNIFSLSKPKTFDLGSYDKGDSRKVSFTKPGVVNVYCHLHPNMSATVFVVPTRYYARADEAGHYEIHGVPPGQYTVVAWHKAAGFFRKQITVSEGGQATANFLLPFSADQTETAVQQGGSSPAAGGR